MLTKPFQTKSFRNYFLKISIKFLFMFPHFMIDSLLDIWKKSRQYLLQE